MGRGAGVRPGNRQREMGIPTILRALGWPARDRFGSTNEGQVFALQASTGKPLWRYQAGGAGRGNPISYTVDGKQQVAVTMGNSLHVFGLE